MPTDDKDWDQHHREIRRKLGWAPLLANGGLIVALVSGAAQSGNLARSIALATAPLVLFGLGAAAGLVSEEFALLADIEWKYGTAWWEVDEGPAKRLMHLTPEINALAASQPMTPEIVARTLERIEIAKGLAERAQKEGPAATDRVRKSVRLNKVAAVLRWASATLCAVGFGTLLFLPNIK